MMNFQNDYYRKTDLAIPLEIIDNSNIQEILDAVDGKKDVNELAQTVKAPPPIFKETIVELVNLGLIEKMRDE